MVQQNMEYTTLSSTKQGIHHIQFNKTRNLSNIVKQDREYITYSSTRQGIYHIWFNKTGYTSHTVHQDKEYDINTVQQGIEYIAYTTVSPGIYHTPQMRCMTSPVRVWVIAVYCHSQTTEVWDFSGL